MKQVIFFGQIIVSLALIAVILIQAKGEGLSSLGGESISRSKRGAEKVFFVSAIILTVCFLVLTLANTLLAVK